MRSWFTKKLWVCLVVFADDVVVICKFVFLKSQISVKTLNEDVQVSFNTFNIILKFSFTFIPYCTGWRCAVASLTFLFIFLASTRSPASCIPSCYWPPLDLARRSWCSKAPPSSQLRCYAHFVVVDVATPLIPLNSCAHSLSRLVCYAFYLHFFWNIWIFI